MTQPVRNHTEICQFILEQTLVEFERICAKEQILDWSYADVLAVYPYAYKMAHGESCGTWERLNAPKRLIIQMAFVNTVEEFKQDVIGNHILFGTHQPWFDYTVNRMKQEKPNARPRPFKTRPKR